MDVLQKQLGNAFGTLDPLLTLLLVMTPLLGLVRRGLEKGKTATESLPSNQLYYGIS